MRATAKALRHSNREAGSHAERCVLGRHADGNDHGESSKNAERTNEHCVYVGGVLESDKGGLQGHR